MSVPRRQQVLLALLGGLLVVLLARSLWPRLVADDGGRDRVRRAARGAEFAVEELRLADLDARPAVYETGRDPFRFGAPPPPPGPTPEQLAEAARLRAAEEARRQALEQERLAAQPAVPPAPQPPAIALRYLGSFGTQERRIAVFTDGENIYNAMVGDVLEGKFIIDAIGFESVDVKFVGFPQAPAQRLQVGK